MGASLWMTKTAVLVYSYAIVTAVASWVKLPYSNFVSRFSPCFYRFSTHLSRIYFFKVLHHIQHPVSDLVFIQVRCISKETQELQGHGSHCLGLHSDARGEAHIAEHPLSHCGERTLQEGHFNLNCLNFRPDCRVQHA